MRSATCLLLLVALITAGCWSGSPSPDALHYSDWKGVAAAILSTEIPGNASSPSPSPSPKPNPGGVCPTCKGVGKLPGDGVIHPPCPDCNGTGRVPAIPPPPPGSPWDATEAEVAPDVAPLSQKKPDAVMEAKEPNAYLEVFTANDCPPCHLLWAELEATYGPKKWQFGPEGHFRRRNIASIPPGETYPIVRLMVDGKEVKHWIGDDAFPRTPKREGGVSYDVELNKSL